MGPRSRLVARRVRNGGDRTLISNHVIASLCGRTHPTLDNDPARARSSMDPSGTYPRFVAYTEPHGPQASTSTSTSTATAATGRGAGPVRRLPKEGVAIMERKSP